MELELSYWEVLDLLNIESEAEAKDFDGFEITPTGIKVVVEDYRDQLTPGEMRVLLTQYSAEPGEVILTLPVAWPVFRRFLTDNGLIGCVDAIKAVDLVLARPQAEQASPGKKPRADLLGNTNAVVGLLTLALVERAGPSHRQITRGIEGPNLNTVAKDLQATAKAGRFDMGGLGHSALGDRLADGLAELEGRRPDGKF